MMVRSTVLSISLMFIATFSFSQIFVEGSLTIDRAAQPGESYEGVIVLSNTGSNTEEAKIYLRDYIFQADGTALYGEPGSHSRSNSNWITFSPNIVRIPPGEKSEVGYRIVVPQDDLNGTYWSILMVEELKQEIQDVQKDQDGFTLSIRQIIRYGIQLVTNIGHKGTVLLAFSNPGIETTDAGKNLRVDIANTGSDWARPLVYCEVYDQLGSPAAKVDAGSHRLYPGTSVRTLFPLDGLKAGTYKVLVIADGGNNNLFGINYTLNIGE